MRRIARSSDRSPQRCSNQGKAQQGARANVPLGHVSCFLTNLRNETPEPKSSCCTSRARAGRGSSLTLALSAPLWQMRPNKNGLQKGSSNCRRPRRRTGAVVERSTAERKRCSHGLAWQRLSHPRYTRTPVCSRQRRSFYLGRSPSFPEPRRVQAGVWRITNRANKAPEPTLGSVTPRATESVYEVRRKNLICRVARGVPAPSVAHL